MAHLSDTRVSTKKYILKYSRQEYPHIYRITAILSPFAARRCHICFKFLLVKKIWCIFITCQQKDLDGASFWQKSIHLETCRYIHCIMALFLLRIYVFKFIVVEFILYARLVPRCKIHYIHNCINTNRNIEFQTRK